VNIGLARFDCRCVCDAKRADDLWLSLNDAEVGDSLSGFLTGEKVHEAFQRSKSRTFRQSGILAAHVISALRFQPCHPLFITTHLYLWDGSSSAHMQLNGSSITSYHSFSGLIVLLLRTRCTIPGLSLVANLLFFPHCLAPNHPTGAIPVRTIL
jgi:hypothetical protein